MNLDIQLFHLLNNLSGQSSLGDGIIVFFATYLAYISIALFIGLVLFSRYSRQDKLYLLMVTGLSAITARFGIAELIRFFHHRPRPFLTLSIHPLFTDPAWSFPSGHATFFFAMAMTIYLHHKKWGTLFFLGAVLISLARVAAGVHYPSDILAGALIGMLAAYIMAAFSRRLTAPEPHQTY